MAYITSYFPADESFQPSQFDACIQKLYRLSQHGKSQPGQRQRSSKYYTFPSLQPSEPPNGEREACSTTQSRLRARPSWEHIASIPLFFHRHKESTYTLAHQRASESAPKTTSAHISVTNHNTCCVYHRSTTLKRRGAGRVARLTSIHTLVATVPPLPHFARQAPSHPSRFENQESKTHPLWVSRRHGGRTFASSPHSDE